MLLVHLWLLLVSKWHVHLLVKFLYVRVHDFVVLTVLEACNVAPVEFLLRCDMW